MFLSKSLKPTSRPMLKTALVLITILSPISSWAAPWHGDKTRKTSGTTEKITIPELVSGKVPGVKFRRNVSYLAPDREEKLDVYLPSDPSTSAPAPIIVLIHGGGWVGGKKDATREIQAGVIFARAGYVAISAEYQKTPGKRWPTNLMDCKNAVRWARVNARDLHADPDNIGVIGGSAGGHLALMVAYTSDVAELEPAQPYPGISDQVNAVVDLYGITNLITRQSTAKDGTPNGKLRGASALFQESREESPAKWELVSPVSHITSGTPATLILHGSADTTVDRDQAKELAAKLKAAGVEHELNIIPNAGHSFILDDSRLKESLVPKVLSFFDKHLKD